jgi:hypothetical protein
MHMTLSRRQAALLSSALLCLAVAPAAHAELPGLPGALPGVPSVVPTPPVPTTPVVDTAALDAAAAAAAKLQEQVDELLGTGQPPADPAALAAAVQALNDLLANAPAGADVSALTDSLTTLTQAANGVLASSSPGTPAVKPAPAVSAAIASGAALSPAAAGSKLARPGRLTIVTKTLVVSKSGKAKLRVLCPITAGGCAGSLKTYSKVGRLKSTGGKVKFLLPGAGKTLTLKFGKREQRRLRKDKKVRVLVLSTFTTRAVRSLKVSVRKK